MTVTLSDKRKAERPRIRQIAVSGMLVWLLTAPAFAQEAPQQPATPPAGSAPAAPSTPATPPPASPETAPTGSPATGTTDPANAAASVQQPPGPSAVAPSGAVQPMEADPAAETASEIGGAGPLTTATGASNPVELDNDAASPAASLPHDLSPWGMFMAADIVVKSVMVGLALASLATWTIWLAKVLELVVARRRAQTGVNRLMQAEGLPTTNDAGAQGWKRGPVAAMVLAASGERAKSKDLEAEGVKERVSIALSRIEARAARRMTRGTGLLATIGSTAPFVGLFGTVWGIMNSFIGISQANTTNLAVVAPGIAEALLATAIGLVAAIPAVIIFNVFARAIAGYKAVLSDGSAVVLQHLSRDLDRAKRTATRPALHAAE